MGTTSRGTVRLTVAHPLVTYLFRPYWVADGHRRRLIPAALGIFAELPGAGVWWDVAPAEVPDQEGVVLLRDEFEASLASERWFG